VFPPNYHFSESAAFKAYHKVIGPASLRSMRRYSAMKIPPAREGKQQEAAKYENQFKSAWRYADVAPEPVSFHDARTACSGTEVKEILTKVS
jgi:hypothetical protein